LAVVVEQDAAQRLDQFHLKSSSALQLIDSSFRRQVRVFFVVGTVKG
jgi:acid phosphatase class B